MPESCACYGCTNRRKKKGGLSFHRFPLQNEQLLAKWLSNVNRADFTPSEHSLVCSDHFRAQDYMNGIHPRDRDPDDHRSLLLPEAVPTIFPAHKSEALKELTSRLSSSLQPGVETQLKQSLVHEGSVSHSGGQTAENSKETAKIKPHNDHSSRSGVSTLLKQSLLHQADGSCIEEQTKKSHTEHLSRKRTKVSIKQSTSNEINERCHGGKTKKMSHTDYPYSYSEGKPKESLHNVQTQLDGAKKKPRGSKVLIRTDDESISQLLKLVAEYDLITKSQLDLLHVHFGEKSFLCFEKEVKKHGDSNSYSDEFKKFAITLHFYSVQAYEFLRECIPLPHPRTICQWSKSIPMLLQLMADNNLITKRQLYLLHTHFSRKSFLCFEKEVKRHGGNFASYSNELKKFVTILHFYSAKAYTFLREFLPLPHPSTIDQWNASTESYPVFLEKVINRMRELVSTEVSMDSSTRLLDVMAIEITDKMSFS